MNLTELVAKLESPIFIRPKQRMTQAELETYLDKAAEILRGKAEVVDFDSHGVEANCVLCGLTRNVDGQVRGRADDLLQSATPVAGGGANAGAPMEGSLSGPCEE